MTRTRSMVDPEVTLQTRDVDGFYSMVRPHIDKMARVARRLAGSDNRDDVVQEALLQAWRGRYQFDPAKGTLSAWLLAITAHEAYKVRRRWSKRLILRFRPPDGVPGDLEAELDLKAALDRLTARERLAIDCHYFAGLSISETAAAMGCSDGTVKSTLSSGRRRLQTILR